MLIIFLTLSNEGESISLFTYTKPSYVICQEPGTGQLVLGSSIHFIKENNQRVVLSIVRLRVVASE